LLSEKVKRLLAYLAPYKRGFLLAVFSLACLAALESSLPALLKPLLDSGFSSGRDSLMIWWVPSTIILIFLLKGIFIFVSTYSFNWMGHLMLRDIRADMYQKLLQLPIQRYDVLSSGLLISRIVSESTGVMVAATNVLTTLIRDSLIVIALFSWMLWINWELTLVTVVLVPILAIFGLLAAKRMRKVSRATLSATGELTRSVEETILGARVIRIFECENRTLGLFKRLADEFRYQAMKMVVTQAIQSPLSQFIVSIGLAVIVAVALYQAQVGTATLGDFVSFVTAMLLMLGPIKHLADVNAQLQRGLASADVVFELLDETDEMDQGELELKSASGHLSFINVSLIYQSRNHPALTNFNAEFRPGETVALVGFSGGGKSSVINLIPRFYSPTQGTILLDGLDINTIRIKSLRAQISIVGQETILFNDSIANNILLNKTNVSQRELATVLEAAALDEFVASLPNKLNTVIGDRGVQLSGGQRQRIAIARALLKNSPILLFDEATSALDNVTESKILNSIKPLRADKTTIIVAHRLSTIIDVEKILVFKNGKVVEAGNHQELLALGGEYYLLYTAKKPSA
jgi:subfamily B ATP-binding cassette protein MsbA